MIEKEPVIVVGKIIDVQDIKGSEKLYKLKIDIGFSIKEVVAGIKKYYKADELLGKKVLVVSNIKPIKIFGIESRGMILAADDGKNVSLLIPINDVKEGTIIKIERFK